MKLFTDSTSQSGVGRLKKGLKDKLNYLSLLVERPSLCVFGRKVAHGLRVFCAWELGVGDGRVLMCECNVDNIHDQGFLQESSRRA